MNSQPRSGLRIVVADDERDTRQFLQEMLTHLGHAVVGAAETGRHLVEFCRANPPDLVVTDIKMPDMDGLDAAAEVNRHRPVPVVVISGHHEAALLERAAVDYVMTYLIKPVKPTDLQAAVTLAVTRFANLQQARGEAAELKQALEDRKVIERAKGAVTRRVGVQEDDAYRMMRKVASDHNRKMIEVAKQILTAEETFRALEEVPGR
jgi:AmiR/NasT family two-component response regulator